jgi:hypothetical protein
VERLAWVKTLQLFHPWLVMNKKSFITLAQGWTLQDYFEKKTNKKFSFMVG